MISRVAESCFWINRYIERVEVLARMLSVNHAFQLDIDVPDADRWRPLLVVTGCEPEFLKQAGAAATADEEAVQGFLTWNTENPSSLFSSLQAARENARTIRETISLEMWETLNDLWVWLGEPAARRLYDSDRHSFYVRLRNQCLLYHGIAQETMLHEDPFEFMRLGTALERAGQTARVLDIKHHSIGPTDTVEETPVETAQWLAVLRFCSGIEPFLKREDRPLSGCAVADFLLFDRAFPRSVLHNLDRARNFLGLVRPPRPTPVGSHSQALLEETLDRLAGMTIERVLEEGLHDVLTWITDTTIEIGNEIHADFFDPTIEVLPPTGGDGQHGRQAQAQSARANEAGRTG